MKLASNAAVSEVRSPLSPYSEYRSETMAKPLECVAPGDMQEGLTKRTYRGV
jgi:hypothetical protein